MTKFTTTLPAADAFGADAKYIVIHPERGEIHSPCSSRQITVERFGFAARGGYQWALIEPDMANLLLAGQPEQGATGDSEVVRLRGSVRAMAELLSLGATNMEAESKRALAELEGASQPVKTIDK